jgi:hypothetical protein
MSDSHPDHGAAADVIDERDATDPHVPVIDEGDRTPAHEEIPQQQRKAGTVPPGTFDAELREVAIVRKRKDGSHMLRLLARTVELDRYVIAWHGLSKNTEDPFDLTPDQLRGLRRVADRLCVPSLREPREIVEGIAATLREPVVATVKRTAVGQSVTLSRVQTVTRKELATQDWGMHDDARQRLLGDVTVEEATPAGIASAVAETSASREVADAHAEQAVEDASAMGARDGRATWRDGEELRRELNAGGLADPGLTVELDESAITPPVGPEQLVGIILGDIELAHNAHHKVVEGQRGVRLSLALMAEGCHLLYQQGGWKHLGYETLSEYLAAPEIEISRTDFYRMVEIWSAYVLNGGVEPQTLQGAGPSKLEVPLPALTAGVVSAEQAVADASTMTRRPGRSRRSRSPTRWWGVAGLRCSPTRKRRGAGAARSTTRSRRPWTSSCAPP